jgi:predicted ATPase
MITQLIVKNFKSLREIHISLSPINILVGQNGAGKSNLVTALRFLHTSLTEGLDIAVRREGGIAAIRTWSAKGRPFDVQIEIKLKLQSDISATYLIVLGSERKGEYRVKTEKCSVGLKFFQVANGQWSSNQPIQPPGVLSQTLALPFLANTEPFDQVYQQIVAWGFYHPLPEVMRMPQPPMNPFPLHGTGENISSTLAEMRKNVSNYRKFLDSFSNFLPDIVDVSVKQQGKTFLTYLKHQISDDSTQAQNALFDLSQESDGTIRLLGILTALYQDNQPTLFVLEEPEMAVHPRILEHLWDEFALASYQKQILLTTHSPELLNLVEPEHVKVVVKEGGTSIIGDISPEQRETVEKHLFGIGELLMAENLKPYEQLELFNAE